MVKEQVNELTQSFINNLQDKGLSKKDIAISLEVTPKALSNWLSGESNPRKKTFCYLATACLKSKSLELGKKGTIGGTAIAGALTGLRIGGIIGGTVGAVVGGLIGEWLENNDKENQLIDEILMMAAMNDSWEEILSLIDDNIELFNLD
jgi:transcriptional regulator with XRE-family HTH domain